MGVQGLFGFLIRTFPSIFKTEKVSIDHLFIDGNALLYEIDGDILEGFREIILLLKNRYGGRVHVFMDGPPPLAKIKQQRERRFHYDPPINGHTNAVFTTGTLMMANVDEVGRKMVRDGEIDTFSSSDEVGEGEHKIMQYIRTHQFKRSAILGKDADLLLLAAGFTADYGIDVHIFRPIDAKSIREESSTYHISSSALMASLGLTKDNVWSFITLSSIFGNDFLPRISSWTINLDNINFIKSMSVSDRDSLLMVFKQLSSDDFNFTKSVIKSMYVHDNASWEFPRKAPSEMKYFYNVDTMVKSYLAMMLWVVEYYRHGNVTYHIQYMFDIPPPIHQMVSLFPDQAWFDETMRSILTVDEPFTPEEVRKMVLPPWIDPKDDLYYPFHFDNVPILQ